MPDGTAAAGELLILIPAAGAARRMRGADKLLQPVAGQPLLARLAAAASSVCSRVIVTLPPGHRARAAAVTGAGVSCLTVEDAAEGMAASLRAGVAQAGDAAGMMVLPADMPELTAADLARLAAAFQEGAAGADPAPILRAMAADGRPGNPVILPAWLFPDVARLRGDTGARDLLRAHAARVRGVALPDEHALTDLDTPEDWAAWRARQPG